MPSRVLCIYIKKINANSRISFLCTLVSGFITYLYLMTNKIVNHNELSTLFKDELDFIRVSPKEGRWSLGFFGQFIGGNFDMQIVVGVLGIFLISCSAGMIVSLLGIEKKLYSGMIGVSMVVFPALVSFIGFAQIGDAWFIEVFMAICAVYLIERKKRGVLFAVPVGCLALGIHQAHFSIATALIFLILFRELLEFETDIKCFMKKVGKYVLFLICSYVAYFLVVKLTVYFACIDMSSYYGLNSMGSFSLRGICKGFVYAYAYFGRYFFTSHYLFSNIIVAIDIVLAIVFLIYVVKSVYKSFSENKFICGFLKIAMVLLLPLGMNILPLLMADRVGAGIDRYMMYSYSMVWVLMLFIADCLERDRQQDKWNTVCTWLIFLGVSLHIGNDYIIDNQAGYRAYAETTQVNNFLNRLAGRMEMIEGWNSDMKVYLVMNSDFFSHYDVWLPEFDELWELRGTAYEPHMNVLAVSQYMKYYLHFPFNEASDEEKALVDKSLIEEMPCYPAEGSIRIVEGIMVVKLDDVADE